MASRTLTMATDDHFVEEVDQSVQLLQKAHPFANYTRSAFMKSAIRRAVAEINAQYGAPPPVRERSSAAA